MENTLYAKKFDESLKVESCAVTAAEDERTGHPAFEANSMEHLYHTFGLE